MKVFLFFFGSVMFASLNFYYGLLILWGRGVGEYAEFNYALSIVAPVLLFFGGGIRMAAVSDKTKALSPQNFIFLRFVFTSISFVVITVIFSALGQIDSRVFWAVFVLKGSEAVYDVLNGLLQANDERLKIGAWLTVSSFITGLASYLIVSLGGGVFWISVMVGPIYLCICGILYRKLAGASPWKYNAVGWKEYQPMIRRISALSFSAFVVSLSINLPRFSLGFFGDMEGLSKLSALLNIVLMASMIVSILSQYLMTRLADNKTKISLACLLIFVAILGGTSSIEHDELLNLIYGNKITVSLAVYAWMTAFMTLVCIAAVLNYYMVMASCHGSLLGINLLGLVSLCVGIALLSMSNKFSLENIIILMAVSYLVIIILFARTLTLKARKFKL